MTVHIDRIFSIREVIAADGLHGFLEGRRPGRHAIVKSGARFGAGGDAGAVAGPQARIVDDLVFVFRYDLAVEPDGGADGAVCIHRIAGPVAAGIGQVKPARIGHAGDFVAEFADNHARQILHGAVIAGAAMQQKQPHLAAIGAGRNFCLVVGLIDHDAHVPIETERVDPEDVFLYGIGDIGAAQHVIGRGDQRFMA